MLRVDVNLKMIDYDKLQSNMKKGILWLSLQ